jgi:CRP/FNR family transcriptional regulator
VGWERSEPYSAESTVDTFVKCLPALLARRIAKDAPASLDWIGAQMAEEARAMQDLARLVALGGALERVAGFIGRLSRKIGAASPCSFALPMTRADMGDHLGLTLETVSRELSRLRRLRVIEIERVTQVVILDPARLRRMGGDLLN